MKEKTIDILLKWIETVTKRKTPNPAELAVLPKIAQMLIDSEENARKTEENGEILR